MSLRLGGSQPIGPGVPSGAPGVRNDAYLMALASEYRADYLVTSDDGLLEMSDVFASSTLDLPVPSVLTP